ncbi:MAG: hypothetical protein ABI644_13190 [Arenimonas sp.]
MRYCLFVLSLFFSHACHAATTASWALPAMVNAAQPNLSQAENGELILSWIERIPAGGHRLKISRYSEQTKWSPPQTIAEGKNFFVNWADFPATQVLADGSLWAHNLEKSGVGTYAYDVVLRRSIDMGKTWAKPMRVNAPVEAEHGFVSLWPWSKTQLGVAWLDGGATIATEDMSSHDHGGSMMTLRAAVVDAKMQSTREWPLDMSVCDCCQTKTALSSRGPVIVYRNRTENEIRDIYTARFDGKRWTPPVRVHADDWKMPACPVNGPAITALQDKVWVAWFTAAQQPAVRIAYSKNAGDSFEPMREVATQNVQGRVDLVSNKDSVWLSWMEEKNGTQNVWLAEYSHDLETEKQRFSLPAVTGNGRATGFPRMALVQNRIHMVWTDIVAGKPQLRGVIVTP